MSCREYIAEEAAALREQRASTAEAELRAAITSRAVDALEAAIDACAAASEPSRAEARRLLRELRAAESSEAAAASQQRHSAAHEDDTAAEWAAARQRAERRDPYEDDASTPTAAERERNELRAQATHARILGEAENGCRRVASGACRFYVTPPINGYYRRLVHELAESHNLAHESVADVGTVYTYNWSRHGKPCLSDC
uniref:R3H domain-containing protein n=2 Tax=Emiliania huxleyi TaxID=2903 RepID=A0A0D3IZB9_EMIH1